MHPIGCQPCAPVSGKREESMTTDLGASRHQGTTLDCTNGTVLVGGISPRVHGCVETGQTAI